MASTNRSKLCTTTATAATATVLLLLTAPLQPSVATKSSPNSSTSPAPWHRFATNINYRLTAILDVNGGASPTCDSTPSTRSTHPAQSSHSAGYSIPIEVLTTLHPTSGKYRQRISYYSGLQVDYNNGGMGYKVVSTPYGLDGSNGEDGHSGDNGGNTQNNDNDQSGQSRQCWYMGGNSSDPSVMMNYLNFFPTVEQMEKYSLGDLITSEPGIPYRIATLEAPHGTYNSTPPKLTFGEDNPSNPSAESMPPDDLFHLLYQEPLSSPSNTNNDNNRGNSRDIGGNSAIPLQWNMLARNQVFQAHTENWVLRYLTYEPLDTEEERKLWEDWFDLKFGIDFCSLPDVPDPLGSMGSSTDGKDAKGFPGHLKLNRLGMFFSSSSGPNASKNPLLKNESPASPSSHPPHHFETFLTHHNKHYPSTNEYQKRKSIHDVNLRKIHSWNELHEGMTVFAPNEFMDLEVEEFMVLRGGRVSPFKNSRKKVENGEIGKQGPNDDTESPIKDHRRRNPYLRSSLENQTNSTDDDNYYYYYDDDLMYSMFNKSNGDGVEDDESFFEFTKYQLPDDFDPSTLPREFDWRIHLPGSVGPIKDQGFCGSCWAFSLLSALESHWFIATHSGQSAQSGTDDTSTESPRLSEQFITDCIWSRYTMGCDGGDPSLAAKFLLDRFEGRVPTREAYGGYLSVDGVCYTAILGAIGLLDKAENENDNMSEAAQAAPEVSSASSSQSQTVHFSDYVVLPSRDSSAIKHALYHHGPLSVLFNVVHESLYYSSGVLDVESCTNNSEENLDHAISLVGWGVDVVDDGNGNEEEREHWILRNSWSEWWGDEGYFRVRMGERDCGVSTAAGFPLVEKTTKATTWFDGGGGGEIKKAERL